MLDALSRSRVDEIVVVEGAHALTLEPGSPAIGDGIASRNLGEPGSGVSVVRCEDWETGPGASLRCGLAALGAGVTRAVVVLADGPNLDPRAIERLLERDESVLAASYNGTRSHPVVLARSAWGDIPDEGGRALEPVLVDCSDLTPPGDIDYRR
ncbi:MAG: nboR [Actinomycetia bacterium]|nr:nboR [Actinomycetes bacterium]